MRVAIVTEWLDPSRGGAETSTVQFLRELSSRGVEVHVFTRNSSAAPHDMSIHTVPVASVPRALGSISFARSVERELRTKAFNVVHAISPCNGVDIYQPRGGTVAETIERNLALRRSSTARLLKRCANRLNMKQRAMLALERTLLGGADGPVVVAISEYVARQLREHYALPDARICKVYNGISPSCATAQERARDRVLIREQFGIGSGDCLVLVIAHNFRLKGVRRWMEAHATLVGRGLTDVRAVVIGRGVSGYWHRLSRRLGIADNLTFAGASDCVSAFRHAADMLVHPTYYDPCSRVVLEALAAGLPCITTRFDGAAEVIEDGKSGYVLDDPWDVAALADRVERLRDNAVRDAFRKSAETASASVSMVRHVTGILDLYESLSRPTAKR